jgi:hypothetical protein
VTSCAGANKSGWSAFLRHLVDRGLKGVRLVISDACRGLVESVADFLPEGRYQRCMVHFYRNVFSQVPSTRVRQVSRMLKAIHAQESRDAADQNQQSAGADHERDQAQRCRRSRRSSRAGYANKVAVATPSLAVAPAQTPWPAAEAHRPVRQCGGRSRQLRAARTARGACTAPSA